MMVDNLPKTVRDLLYKLDTATAKIKALNESQGLYPEEMSALILILKQCRSDLDADFWNGKTLAPTEMQEKIEQALLAVALFQANQPGINSTAQKNVTQAITAVFATLRKEVGEFDVHLRNLKDIKIGRKIEGVSPHQPF